MNKIVFRLGDANFELESSTPLGDQDFEQAFAVLERFKEVAGARRHAGSAVGNGAALLPSSDARGEMDVSMDTFVSRLGGGSCRNILKAAAAHLTLVSGQPVFSKQDWYARAHEAHEWQKDYASMQSRDTRRMINAKEIIEKQGGMFAVPPKALADIKAKTAED